MPQSQAILMFLFIMISGDVAKLLAVSARKSPANLQAKMGELNGLVSLMYILDGKVIGVMSFGGDGTKISSMRASVEPG